MRQDDFNVSRKKLGNIPAKLETASFRENRKVAPSTT